MIQIECPNCKSQLKAPDEAAGRTAKCKKCNTPIKIPVLQTASVSTSATTSPTPSSPPPPIMASMKTCDFCGEEVLAAAKKCKHCGEILDPSLRAAEESRRTSEVRQQGLVQPAPTIVQVVNQQPKWSRGVARVLSFFLPGVGQIYKGQLFNGLLWMCLVVFCYILTPFTLGASFFFGLLLHLLCIIGAGSGKNQ